MECICTLASHEQPELLTDGAEAPPVAPGAGTPALEPGVDTQAAAPGAGTATVYQKGVMRRGYGLDD